MSGHRHRARRPRWWRLVVLVAGIVVCSLAGTGVWAYWTAGSGPGGNGAAAAVSVGKGATPTVTATGTSVAVSWAASTLTNGTAVTGYRVKRYNATTLAAQTILSSCSGTISTTSCTESAVPTGQWKYTVTPVFATNWAGTESAMSATAYTDPTAPADTITLTPVTGTAVLTGTTVYYRGSAAGSFTLTNAVADAGSGPVSSTTAALAGTSTGWTHTPSTVTTPSGGPYVSAKFSWAAGTTSSPTEVITGRDLAGNLTPTTLTFVNDSTAPLGTISYTNGYQVGKYVTVSFTGADAGSGLASARLQRATATLVNGVCGTFSAFANVGSANPTSPYTDTAVSNSQCYNYRYALTDNLGNSFTATSANTAWVDYAGAVRYATTGILTQWRLGDSSLLSGTTALDSAGSNSGVYANGVVEGVNGELPNDTDTAATFDGSNDDVQAATTSGLPTGASPRSVELWFKTTATGQQSLFSYGSRANNEEFGLWINSGGSAMTAWGYGGGNDPVFTMPYAINDGKWHQVVDTFNGSSITLYIDGVALPAQSVTRATVIDSYGFGIGAVIVPGDGNSGFYFRGSIDEVSVYTVALSQTTVTNHYQLGANPSADTTGPSGGAVTVTGLTGTGPLYSTSTTLHLTLATGTDAGGIAATGAQLFRASAPLTSSAGANGACGTFTGFTLVATDPSAPVTDAVSDQRCYAYAYAVADTAGNYTTYASGTVKVDSTAPPTPVLTASATTATYFDGSTLFYRSTAGTGSVKLTVASSDSTSGIATYAFPTFGSTWTVSGTGAARTYGWTTGPTNSGTETVTVTNNAGQSSSATFGLQRDIAAPTGASLDYQGGTQSSTSIPIALSNGTDAGSGIASAVLQRSTATRYFFGCYGYSGYATVAGATAPSYADTGSSGHCYKYQWVVTDNVGNVETITGTDVVQVQ